MDLVRGWCCTIGQLMPPAGSLIALGSPPTGSLFVLGGPSAESLFALGGLKVVVRWVDTFVKGLWRKFETLEDSSILMIQFTYCCQ